MAERKSKRREVFEMFNGRCAYCGKAITYSNFHIDHIVPKSVGGILLKDNSFPSCTDCNIYKSNSDIEEFRTRLESILDENIYTRLVSNYYRTKKRRIVFYFEKVRKNG